MMNLNKIFEDDAKLAIITAAACILIFGVVAMVAPRRPEPEPKLYLVSYTATLKDGHTTWGNIYLPATNLTAGTVNEWSKRIVQETSGKYLGDRAVIVSVQEVAK